MIIIHGENQIESRKKLLELKKQNSLTLFSDSLTIEQLMQCVSNPDLFGNKQDIIIENLLSKPQNKNHLITFLRTLADQNIILWENKDITPNLKNFPKAQVYFFTYPKHLFSFLDNLDIESYRACSEELAVEQILASLATRIHKVLMGEGRFKIKLTNAQLRNLNQALLDLDYKNKLGKLPLSLTSSLELVLLSL